MHVWAYVSVCKSIRAYTHMYFACLYQWTCVYSCSYHETVNNQVLLCIYTRIFDYMWSCDYFFFKTEEGWIKIDDIVKWLIFFYIAITIFFLLIQLLRFHKNSRRTRIICWGKENILLQKKKKKSFLFFLCMYMCKSIFHFFNVHFERDAKGIRLR